MTGFSNSPRLLKAGLVLLDPAGGQVQRIVSLQYNPDTLSRTLQVQAHASESGDRSEALRVKGPPVETIKLEAEIDATDQLEFPDRHPNATHLGIHPQLAALETLVLFVWSKSRVVPVRVTEFSVTEEAFDPALNPIRAKVSLGLRVLSVDDLGFAHKGGSLFMSYLQNKETLASKSAGGMLGTLGLEGLP